MSTSPQNPNNHGDAISSPGLSRRCLGCAAALQSPFLNLGRTPLANSYLKPDQDRHLEEKFPLAVAYCDGCHIVQLTDLVAPEKLFSEYLYFSSYSESFLAHAKSMAAELTDRFRLGPASRVLEIASNDGYLLQYFQHAGLEVLGVEPARNIAAVAQERGIPTLNAFFDSVAAADIRGRFGLADLIVGNNVLAHVPTINDFLAAVAAVLAPSGASVFEFPYLGELLDNSEFDTIYHEHVFYYSLTAIRLLAERAGLELFDVAEQSIHGGSLRVFLQHPEQRPVAGRVEAMLKHERDTGLTNADHFISFGLQVETLKRRLVSLLQQLKSSGNRLAAYGAPAKGNTLLNYCGIGPDLIEFTVDRSPHKQNMLLPGSHLPILAPSELTARRPDYTLILPWNIADEIIEQQRQYLRAGGQFIVPIPEPRILIARAEDLS
jgi:SAM-dependent methyltransferase